MPELTRNHFFAFGLFVLLIGVQLRVVESFVLSTELTQRLASIKAEVNNDVASKSRAILAAAGGDSTRKSFSPPEWAGWLTISIGAVFIMHALSMQKPGGGG